MNQDPTEQFAIMINECPCKSATSRDNQHRQSCAPQLLFFDSFMSRSSSSISDATLKAFLRVHIANFDDGAHLISNLDKLVESYDHEIEQWHAAGGRVESLQLESVGCSHRCATSIARPRDAR